LVGEFQSEGIEGSSPTGTRKVLVVLILCLRLVSGWPEPSRRFRPAGARWRLRPAVGRYLRAAVRSTRSHTASTFRGAVCAARESPTV